MTEKLYEAFTWIRDDLKFAGVKGNKAQFKGICLVPTISGNGRKYVDEELHRSARTLVGKPLTLNHRDDKILGDVTWAEYENGSIEYVAETKNAEYSEKLRDRARMTKESYVKKWGRDPIYGVSVQANYRYHESQCVGGHCTIEPHGIIFNALSLVEDPEKPGVGSTSVELMETQAIERRLTEMLIHDLVPKQDQSSILTEQDTSNKMSKTENNEDCGCPPGQHKNDSGECVPNEEEGMEEKLLSVKHQIEADTLKRAKETKAINDSIVKTKTELNSKITEIDTAQKTCCNRLGEAQKQLVEVEAIAKGSLEKITGLEPKFESFVETWQTKLTSEASTLVSMANDIKTDVGKLKETDKAVNDKLAVMETASKSFTETLAQTVTKTQLAEALSKIPNIDDKLKPLLEVLAQTQGKLSEIEKKHDTLNSVYEALEKKHSDFVKETNTQKLKETQESSTKLKQLEETLTQKDKTLKEMQDQIDTLKLHVPPNFKATPEEKKQEANFSPPYKY